MTRKRSPVDAAFRRVEILRTIVRAERLRAEAAPFDRRCLDLGIIEEDTPRDRAKATIADTFNEIEALLDHLSIAHMAAAFEEAAKAKMTTIIGEARKAIEKGRGGRGRWPVDLVRGTETFEGLRDLGAVLRLDVDEDRAFRLIREVRNGFSHGARISAAPVITGNDTRDSLGDLLDRIR